MNWILRKIFFKVHPSPLISSSNTIIHSFFRKMNFTTFTFFSIVFFLNLQDWGQFFSRQLVKLSFDCCSKFNFKLKQKNSNILFSKNESKHFTNELFDNKLRVQNKRWKNSRWRATDGRLYVKLIRPISHYQNEAKRCLHSKEAQIFSILINIHVTISFSRIQI